MNLPFLKRKQPNKETTEIDLPDIGNITNKKICPCGDPSCYLKNNFNNYYNKTANALNTTYNTGTTTGLCQEKKDAYCRVCGKSFNNYAIYNYSILKPICKDCKNKINDLLVKIIIPKNSKVHCFKCFSHINACICDGKKAIDNLKK